MAKLAHAVVANLQVIRVGVHPDTGAVLRVGAPFIGDELASLNEHALTAAPDRCKTTIFRACDKAVFLTYSRHLNAAS